MGPFEDTHYREAEMKPWIQGWHKRLSDRYCKGQMQPKAIVVDPVLYDLLLAHARDKEDVLGENLLLRDGVLTLSAVEPGSNGTIRIPLVRIESV